VSRTRTWREVRTEAVRSGRLDEDRVAAHKERLLAELRDYEATEAGADGGLPPVHPCEVLVEEFLEPLGISVAELAERLRVPVERVEALARCERSVTADDALRLSRFFATTPEFWLNLQAQHDLEAARAEIAAELEAIAPRAGEEGP